VRISHEYKFIWVSKPKTGSTSYRELLDPHCEVKSQDHGDFYHHSGMAKIKSVFEKNGWDFDSYKKIVPVRNPYKLLVSLYTYSKMDIAGNKWWESNEKEYDSNNLMKFREFLTNQENLKWFFRMHRLESYIFDETKKDCADLIFDPTVDENTFKNYMLNNCKLDLSLKTVPWINMTSKSNQLLSEVDKCFNDKSVLLPIQDIFSYELERFDFKNPFEQSK
jgi:hypothetical protein